MPFLAASLIPLLAADSFTLWLYKTPDTRAAVLAAGYFAPAAGRLAPGHLVVLEAADATAILPVRSGAAVGNGLVVDATSQPIRLTAAGRLDFAAGLSAAAVLRSVRLSALPNGVNEGESFTVQAAASGVTSTLAFSILDAAGATVRGPVSVPVAAGGASTTFVAPSPGNGYRLKVVDAADPLVAQLSPSFVVLSAFALLLESGASLLAEAGGRLVM